MWHIHDIYMYIYNIYIDILQKTHAPAGHNLNEISNLKNIEMALTMTENKSHLKSNRIS